MAKIMKRTVDALQPDADHDVFAWDSELRGFGIRVKPSGVKTFLIQYRNVEGRTRRLVLGQYGALTPENARDLAREKLAGVAKGEDPSAERHAVRAGMSVSEVCDWYQDEAGAGRILGRNRRPIKASTLKMDRSRIETHIKPLLGTRLVSGLTLRDIEGMQADIAAGKSARGRKVGRGGKSSGGSGVASRTVGTLRGLLGHAARLKIVGKNPAVGVRQLAVERRQQRLNDDELRHLGRVMRGLAAEGEHPTGLAAIRTMLLSGFRRMEVLVPYRLTLDAFCVEIPCDQENVVPWSAGRNGLNPQGSYPLNPLMREQSGGCESADHPNLPVQPREQLCLFGSGSAGLGLKRTWVSRRDHCVRFPDTKSGAQIRVLGETAISCVEAVPGREGSPFVFPADWGDGHFVGVVRVLQRVCAKAKLKNVTPHALRHTFASVAGDLGFSELTIAGLLGHSARGVTQGYIHLDGALVVAADRVSAEIAGLLDGSGAANASTISARRETVSGAAA